MGSWWKGLLGRILLALLVVGLLPWGIASFRLLSLNREAMTEQVLRTHAVAAGTTASRVEAFLETRRLAVATTAGSTVLVAGPRTPEGTEVLASLLRSPLAVAAAAVFNLEGGEVLRVQRRDPPAAVSELLSAPSAEAPVVVRDEVASWVPERFRPDEYLDGFPESGVEPHEVRAGFRAVGLWYD